MSGLYEQLQDNSMNQNPHIIQHEIEEVVSVVPQDPRVQAHGQLPDDRVHTVHRVHTIHHILRVQTVSLHQQECEQRAEEGQQGSHHQGGCAVSCARVPALVTCHVSQDAGVSHVPVSTICQWSPPPAGAATRLESGHGTGWTWTLSATWTHSTHTPACDTRLIGASDYF